MARSVRSRILGLVQRAMNAGLLMIESVEAIREPTWEFRQWVLRPGANPNSPTAIVFENPPLTESVDPQRVASGPLRSAFLSHLGAHQAEILAGHAEDLRSGQHRNPTGDPLYFTTA